MCFKNYLDKILKKYEKEYYRPFKYIDPRNISKKGETNLLDEHNQTINFCNAIRACFKDSVAWYELSIGLKPPKKGNVRHSPEAIDGIVYIPKLKSLLIIESKGLRKSSKFEDIKLDLERTLGKNRTLKDIEKYIIQIEEPQKMYAITLADIWGEKDNLSSDGWNIDFDNAILKSRKKCKEAFETYKELIGNGTLKTSKVRQIGNISHRLLVMVYEMSTDEIKTYTFKKAE